jgi:hypothetical protein
MGKKAKRHGGPQEARTGPGATGPWLIHFFRRHRGDDPDQSVPAREYLDACPVAARLIAVVKAVADAPPPAFSGGGKWEAMHGDMAGYYEVRVDGPQRRHYRLFCLLERDGARVGLGGPSLVIITGMDKPFRSTFSGDDYAKVRRLGDEYKRRIPRSAAR